jgi:tetratricopeptide (TPR) repeat protein
MSLRDCRGVPVSTSDPASLERLERASELTASYFMDPLAAIDEALAHEPDFAMAHCLKAALAVMSTEKAARPMLADSVTALDQLAGVANARERAHAAAARAWLDRDFARSIRLYGDILLDHPRDLLALQAAHVGDFLLGASQLLRDRVAQVLPHWDRSVPGFGYVQGMYAFGLEENAHYGRAEETGLQALARNPRDPWAVHAVVHVMEMQGRAQEGADWLSARAGDWSENNGLAFHLWWHQALYNLDLGRPEQALAIYDRIRAKPSRIAYENVDASALLWRLAVRGVETGARWQALADDWAAMAEDGHYAFNDVHAVMAYAGAGRTEAAARTVAAMESRIDGGGTNAAMTREVGLPLARALVAFWQGRHDECIEGLLGIRTIAHQFGGSHAQRDLLHLTLVEAALRAGRRSLAVALASERTELKPQSPFNRLLARRAVELPA